ncbi:MFS multidrug resistance transporter [Blastomyces gilchristii SLH14081]|uniref:MFS multidrug resistance transporter n=1 Tax=Blastomyces gilchristii (strain SLH14081) TaxID=559298 RepID=A0A179UQJ7_BLAGS|nr:MFS multidrug resistance transporter [Blastomyces gilchristii SLH14081]OAT08682.1 MFS multidrug resistance transporter [Blastomyces gilchristii SLH14081]
MAFSESDGEVNRLPAREYETPVTEKYHGTADRRDVIGEQGLPRTDDIRGDAKSSRSRSCSRAEDGGGNLATRQGTNSYSAAVVVPRNKRRGLLGRLALLPEVEDPQKYPRKTKWLITLIIAIAAVAAPLGSAIFYPALGEVASSLNTTPTVTNLSIALYMLSMGICPLWWSTFSETFGRRSIYIISFSLFNVFNILSGVATSIEMLIVLRLFSGGAAASVQAIGAGTIADIWESRERGRAMGTFFLGPLCGPLLAPIIGGAMSQAWGWRSTQWFLTIYGGVSLLILTFGLPETLVSRKNLVAEVEPNAELSRTLSRVSSRQVAQNTAKWLKILRMIFVDPLQILLYLRFPAVLLTVLYSSITFGSLYVLNISIQTTFSQPPYNFPVLLIGLLYIPHSIGYIISSILGGMWMDSIMQREARKANRVDESGMYIYRPEDRMGENAWLGAFIYPAAMIWYGWTAEKHLFWAIPIIANFFFGVGSMIIFSMSTTMLTEFMPQRSSSGVAVNNFMRNIFSCVGGVVAAPIIHAIGNGWLFTILALVAFAAGSVIWAMRRFGPRWRLSMEARVN